MKMIFGIKPRLEEIKFAMRAGKTWPQIANQIGWELMTLRVHWQRHMQSLTVEEREQFMKECGIENAT